MIARAEQQFFARIPDRESKISAQMLHALRAPRRIRSQNQAGVCDGAASTTIALQCDFLFQFLAAVNARIRGDPQLAVEAGRLLLNLRFARRAQHGMAQANRARPPGPAPVRPAIGKERPERLQQPALHRRATALVNAHDAAQSMRASRGVIGPSNGTKYRCSAAALFNTAEAASTPACASKRSNSLRAPMRNSAAKIGRAHV